MAVIFEVEDGTGLATANAFAAVADVDQWAANRATSNATQYDVWAALVDNTKKQQCIILATDYLRNEERYWWRGLKLTNTQALPFPRTGCVPLFGTGTALPSNIVPLAVNNACCELACKVAQAAAATTMKPLQPDLARGGMTKTASAARGLSVTYMDNALRETLIQLSAGILKPLLRKYANLPVNAHFVPDIRGYVDVRDPASQLPASLGVEDRAGDDYQNLGSTGVVSGQPLPDETP